MRPSPATDRRRRREALARIAAKALREVRPVILGRSRGLCEMCSEQLGEGWELSHRIHSGMGGTAGARLHVASNLLASCGPDGCNQRLSHNGPFLRLGRDMGWLLHHGQDPELEPAAIGGRVVVVDDGGLEVLGGVMLWLTADGTYAEAAP